MPTELWEEGTSSVSDAYSHETCGHMLLIIEECKREVTKVN
jgi:hypothetical protein